MLWDNPRGAICPICPIELSMFVTLLPPPLHDCPFDPTAFIVVPAPGTVPADVAGEPRSIISLGGDTDADPCLL